MMGYFRPARAEEEEEGEGIIPARMSKILKIWNEEGGAGGISLTDALMTKTRRMI